jgi:hypothetical protein
MREKNFQDLNRGFLALWRSAGSLVIIDFSKYYTSTTFNLKMKAAGFSEMFVITNNTWCHHPEDLTNSMKQGPFLKPSVHQLLKNRYLNIIWNHKIHCHVQKNQTLVSILMQINPFHTIQSYFSKIHYNISLPDCLFPSQPRIS